MLNFKTWFESVYDRYRQRVEGISRDFVFKSWFQSPNMREYIPFGLNDANSETKKELESFINEFGYELVNYKLGHARKIGEKNITKINSILDRIAVLERKDLNNKLQQGLISQMKHDTEQRSVDSRFKELKNNFENDPSRKKAAEFYVVISGNRHDLASMSTDKGWTSCMNLAGGKHAKDVYCEVKNGGFVAYLINSNDKDIKKPIARIHIRRFTNKKNESMALPEETIYGNEVPGFKEVVQKWLDERQSPRGLYKRIGGKYSDSYKQHMVISSKTQKDIERWINKWLNMNKEDRKKYNKYFIAAVDEFMRNDYNWSKKTLNMLKDFMLQDGSIQSGDYQYQHFGGYFSQFAIKYSDIITKDDIEKYISKYAFNNEFLEKFKDYIDVDMLKTIIKNTPSYQIFKLLQLRPDLADDYNKLIDSNPLAKSEQDSWYKFSADISNKLSLISNMKHVPESVLRNVINWAKEIENTDFGTYEDVKPRILGNFIETLGSIGADTPSVQRFLKDMLKYWDKIGLFTFGETLAKLGINGRDFLPFLYNKLKEVENLDKDYYDRGTSKKQQIERYKYVIDSIETGTGHSLKYVF